MSGFPWQADQWHKLMDAHNRGRLHHALLLSGPEGIGTDEFATRFAARVLCHNSSGYDEACGSCKSCSLFMAGNHPDLMWVEPESPGKAIKVDAIRQVIDYINMRSHFGQQKLVIIRQAHNMNRHASNGLLKSLEEPPSESRLMLLAEKPSMLPVTIRSRCQRLEFPPVRSDQATGWLKEKLTMEQEELQELLSLAGGAPLRAIELAESGSLQLQVEFLSELASLRSHPADPVKTARKWLESEQELVTTIKQLLGHFATMSRQKLGERPNKSTIHKPLQGILKGLDLVQVIRCYDALSRLYRELEGPYNLNKQGLVEEFIVSWQAVSRARGG